MDKYISVIISPAFGVTNMRPKYFLMASVAMILFALVAAGCLEEDDDGEDEVETIDFQVEVSYDGNWTGTIDADGTIQNIEGNGTKTINVTAEKITVNITRDDNGTGSLQVNLLEDDLPLAGNSSTGEFVAITYPDEE